MNARRLLEAKNKEFGITERLKETRTTKPKPKPEADVIDIETKKKVDEKGLGSLRDDFGLPEGVDPKSERGKLIQELQRSTAGSKKAEELAKNIVDDMLGPFGPTRDLMREGQRRAVVRQIMLKDKRIRLPADEFDDLLYSRDLERGTDAKDPLELFDKYYTRNNTKFDALDDIIDGSRSPEEAAEEFIKEFDGFDIVAPAKPKPASLENEVDELDEFLDDTPRDDKAKGGLADILGV
tara:strand:- start:764 stop:1477 length:714 start_codon:yes stop_codon:yes gene_type:complete